MKFKIYRRDPRRPLWLEPMAGTITADSKDEAEATAARCWGYCHQDQEVREVKE